LAGVLGNPYKVSDHGRAEAIRLYQQNTLPVVTHDLIRRVKAASFVGCFCAVTERCHTDSLIEAAFK
jgi:hypothetical protein